MALLSSDLRRMSEPEVKEPAISSEELDQQVQEFLAKGGEIKRVEPGKSAIDFTVTNKPGETYGKRAI